MPRVRTLTPGASPTHFFGSEVRRAREAAGMSQAELGALVPCDKSVVSRIEAGLTQPDESFARACDAAFPHLRQRAVAQKHLQWHERRRLRRGSRHERPHPGSRHD
jgi:ribosome-binding protein aMBF1 (putative translation factor)